MVAGAVSPVAEAVSLGTWVVFLAVGLREWAEAVYVAYFRELGDAP